ncbi:hypothetical protein ARMGADRAFT_1048099 [Armillaria gallica]|uniref:CxC5 like cysteine cluster associated with KDZ domain-containing protein n=1 Tax=Armillaria gallica TaxID=47427 RepID=A0A2H3D384_ARMGA|nr:hypothetical protein ARMGADRAFT_1048099 [Armillaria gallica]
MLWDIFKDTIWIEDEFLTSQKDVVAFEALFRQHGHEYGFVSPHSLYPPIRSCTNALCPHIGNEIKLQSVAQCQALLFTIDHGPVPVWVVHFMCNACGTIYHHEYCIQQGTHSYYDDIPDVLQIREHYYAERRLIESWRSNMNLAWVSAFNCANIYLVTHCKALDIPLDWIIGTHLSHRHGYDAIILLSLWEDSVEQEVTLSVPHSGHRKECFTEPMQAWNRHIKLCNKSGRTVSLVVCDGNAMGRPCCCVHNCQIPLRSTKHQFCKQHGNLINVCSIKDCDMAVIPEKHTCNNLSHQEIEQIHVLQGQSHSLPFKTQEQEPTETDDEDIAAEDEEEEYDMTDGVAHLPSINMSLTNKGKNKQGKRLRAQFGHAWTHNEQFLVVPCGMIIARETFYGTEAIASVAEFIKRTYHDCDMPNHVIFDNNCQLAKHVKNDPVWKNVGLSVDVFHFNCKHLETDTFCQQNCNPIAFPELCGEDRKGWWFNTSIAEQTNTWVGGYHSICYEMHAD